MLTFGYIPYALVYKGGNGLKTLYQPMKNGNFRAKTAVFEENGGFGTPNTNRMKNDESGDVSNVKNRP